MGAALTFSYYCTLLIYYCSKLLHWGLHHGPCIVDYYCNYLVFPAVLKKCTLGDSSHYKFIKQRAIVIWTIVKQVNERY